MCRLFARCAGLVCLFAVAAVGRAEEVEQAQLLRQRQNCPPPCLPAPYQPGMPAQPGQPGQPSPFNQPGAQNQPTPQDEGARGAALASGEGALPNVIGDLLNPDELLPFPLNSVPGGFPAALLTARSLKAPAQLPNFKIAEDENVRPIDRIYGGFNYFNDVNGRINRILGAELGQLNAHRETLGVEKTFWQGEASFGIRLPIDTLFVNGTPFPQLNGTFTSVGDISLIFKRALWERPGGLFTSGGLLMTVPTGQESFGGGGFARSARDVTFQPFLGYIVPFQKLYVQGFWSWSVPTDWGRDVTMIFNDVSVGYRLYRDPCGCRFVTAVTPQFELHVNTPLNHRGAFNGPAGTPDTVIFTEGLTIELRRKALLTFAVCEPITEFQPFDIETVVQLNWRF